jgi:hypothetical protein
LIIFSIFFWSFHEPNGGGKNDLGQLFQAKCLKEKGSSPKEEKKSNPTHVPPRKSGLSCFGELLPLGRKGLNSPRNTASSIKKGLSSRRSREQAPEYLTKKFSEQMLFKSNGFYNIEKLLKYKYFCFALGFWF